MLKLPESRQRFDEIRARWEAVQANKHPPAGKMGGRRSKPLDAIHPAEDVTEGSNRKLHRFSSITSFIAPQTSFMSKTFLRKKQPRASAANASMATLLGADESEALLGPNNQSPDIMRLSPMKFSPASYTPSPSDDDGPPARQPLPRSKTMSNIPVLISRSRASSTAQSITSNNSRSSTAFRGTRIPTPVQKADHRNAKYIAAGNAFAPLTGTSPNKTPRSHTTPNLLAAMNEPRNTFMTQRKSLYEKKPTTPVVTRQSNKENIRRASKFGGYSQLEDRTTRRDSRSSEGVENPRATNPRGKGKQTARNPSILGTNSPGTLNERTRTPVAVKRYRAPPADSQSMSKLPRLSSTHEITQVKLLGPRNPPTPPTPKTPGIPSMPSSHNFATTRNAQHGAAAAIRRKPPAPSLGNRRASSQLSSVRLAREVRSMMDLIPPVPPIPAKYATPPSVPSLPHAMPPPENSLAEALAERKPDPLPDFTDVLALRQISQSMPMSYWCGRFTTLSDQFRTAECDRALRPIDDTDDSDVPDISDERRFKLVFKELSSVCITTEARESLRSFQMKFAMDHKIISLIPGPVEPIMTAFRTKILTDKEPVTPPSAGSSTRKTSFIERLMGRSRKSSASSATGKDVSG